MQMLKLILCVATVDSAVTVLAEERLGDGVRVYVTVNVNDRVRPPCEAVR